MRMMILAAAAATALSGCAYQSSPNVYDPYAVGQAAFTEMGTIQSTRPVTIEGQGAGSGVGAVIGAVAGGVAGSQIGPSRYHHRGHSHRYTSAGSALGTIGGALIGGLIGAAIERDVTRQTATEYVVRLDDGALITIVQGSQPLAAGQRVFVQTPNQGRARIVPAA